MLDAKVKTESYLPDPADQVKKDIPTKDEKSSYQPYLDAIERINYAIIAGNGEKPTYYFETTQPLYQDDGMLNTVFIQPRISISKDMGTYNLGLGYRRLLFDEQLLLGGNVFFDYQDHHNHHRAGVGFEAFTKYLEYRMNGYFPTSHRRQVDESADYIFYERGVPGMDGSIGGQIPYVPWLKAFFGGYWYDYRYAKDREGWDVRLEAKPLKYTTINVECFKDTMMGDNPDWRVDMRTSIPMHGFDWKEICAAFAIPATPYPAKNLKHMTLIRVERNNKIEVEKYAVSKTTGLVVAIGRGN